MEKKTRFSADELEKFRGLLKEKKRQLLELGEGIRNGVLKDISAGRNEDFAHPGLHAADVGSTFFDEQVYAGLADKELRKAVELDEALSRLDDGSFGLCQECKEEIPTPRLEAVPETHLCVDCATVLENEERQAVRTRKSNEQSGYYNNGL